MQVGKWQLSLTNANPSPRFVSTARQHSPKTSPKFKPKFATGARKMLQAIQHMHDDHDDNDDNDNDDDDADDDDDDDSADLFPGDSVLDSSNPKI